MTEEQMQKRMKEIDEERDKLRFERQEYEKYFSDKKRKEELDNHKNYIGKCYLTKKLRENENRHIEAFRILQVLDSPNERYAICATLIDGYRYTCFQEYGVQIMTLPLWSSNKLRMMSKETDPKMLDFYTEIDQEDFYVMYKLHKQKIDNGVFCAKLGD